MYGYPARMKLAKSIAVFAALIIGIELFLLVPFVVLSGSETGMQVLLVAIFSALVAVTGLVAIAVWRRRFARLK